ncbi:MAG: type II toxin-antitoxin system VapC family toxin [Dehalococcoidia bacterium]|nr:type II toxin-antitoxin system VapC family toxin [Dehalococcoidia bacterium]
MKTAVDTNILFDLLAADPNIATASLQALSQAMSVGPVVICPVVYAELAAGFPGHEEVALFVHDLRLHLEAFTTEALYQAGSAWKRYTSRRGRVVQCPRCGQTASLQCSVCQAPLTWRQHIIPDFLVGGHALQQADRLLTRDYGYYHLYFPTLQLVGPDSLVP